MEALAWIEQSAPSIWIRESTSLVAFPGILVLHTVGLAFLVGISTAIDLRLLGFAPQTRLSPLLKFFPVLWFGFWINAASGIALLVAYPTKAVTNPLFFLKLACIGSGIVIIRLLRNQVLAQPGVDERPVSRKGKRLALASLLLWIGATAAGRLLAYTYNQMMAS